MNTHKIIAYDLETTGVDPTTAEVLEICAVEILDKWDIDILMNTRCYPSVSGEIPNGASQVHGITIDDVAYLPDDVRVIAQFVNLIESCGPSTVILGYNIDAYDTQIIKRYSPEFEYKSLDIYRLVLKYNFLFMGKTKLGQVYESLLGTPLDDAHQAYHDVHASIAILEALQLNLDKTTAEFIEILSKPIIWKVWPWGKYMGVDCRDVPLEYFRYLKDATPQSTIQVDMEATLNFYLEI